MALFLLRPAPGWQARHQSDVCDFFSAVSRFRPSSRLRFQSLSAFDGLLAFALSTCVFYRLLAFVVSVFCNVFSDGLDLDIIGNLDILGKRRFSLKMPRHHVIRPVGLFCSAVSLVSTSLSLHVAILDFTSFRRPRPRCHRQRHPPSRWHDPVFSPPLSFPTGSAVSTFSFIPVVFISMPRRCSRSAFGSQQVTIVSTHDKLFYGMLALRFPRAASRISAYSRFVRRWTCTQDTQDTRATNGVMDRYINRTMYHLHKLSMHSTCVKGYLRPFHLARQPST